VDLTDAFKELFPIERRQEAHACDDVPYGDLGRRLPLMLDVNCLFYCRRFEREFFLDPIDRRPYLGILIAQTLRELNYERSVELFLFPERRFQERDKRARLAASRFQELVGERIRPVSRISRRNYSERKPPEALNQ